MGIYTKRESLIQALLPFRKNKRIGFVPTMGALHSGHLSLVKTALDANDCVVVSIFVNPTQFDNTGDLDKYPRTLEVDVDLLNTLQGKVFIFAPEASVLYNDHVVAKTYRFGSIAHEMEGKHRQGHFDGVGTVLNILFRIVQPDAAYFGEKDYQQLQIVKKLVQIEKLPVQIVGCPIVRENNGLAMSSRNKRLTKAQFEAAGLISKTLFEAKERFKKQSIDQINQWVSEQFNDSSVLSLEYFEIANAQTLKTVERRRSGNKYRAFIAAFAGDIRLIDNIALN